MELRILSATDVGDVLTAEAAVDAMRRAFSQISNGEAVVPIRGGVESTHGITLLMPAFLGGSSELGAKIVSAFPGNAARGEPPIMGAVIVLDVESGRPRALLDGTSLTGVRTAAGSGLATELLADPEADVLAVFGAGTQGESHIRLFAALRRLREVRIVSRTVESATALADRLRADAERLRPREGDHEPPEVRAVSDPRAALDGAGLIVTATTSLTPVFADRDLEPAAHVNAVGSYRPDMQEVDADTVVRARVFVDQREAAWEEAGDLIAPLREGRVDRDFIAGELGDILIGRVPGGREGHDVTLFKSVGNAAQDVAIAETALREAERRGIGQLVPF